jgi:hypothetical protein
MKPFLAVTTLLFSSLTVLGQANVARLGDNLVLENIPAIPASIVEQAYPYGEVRTASLADWDPSRLEMLITTRFSDVPQVHQVKMPGGARTQLTFFPDRVTGAHYVRREAITSRSSRM